MRVQGADMTKKRSSGGGGDEFFIFYWCFGNGGALFFLKQIPKCDQQYISMDEDIKTITILLAK